MIRKLCVTALITIQSGCIPFMSNEQQTALWMSQKERIASFKRQLDFQIGKEYYTPVKKEEWCKSHKCTDLGDSVMEYIEESFNKNVPSKKCIIAWRVDEKQSTGNYHYPPGPVFYGLGKRLSWRYVSDKEQCLTTISFWGPW